MPASMRGSPPPAPPSYRTPLSPSDSQRSREPSWASVFVTPFKARQAPNGDDAERAPPEPVTAPIATQRSARRYCNALVVAAVATGCFHSLSSPALMVFLGHWPRQPSAEAALASSAIGTAADRLAAAADEWWWGLFAIGRLVLCIGRVLPPASPARSVRVYVRAALGVRTLVWLLLLPRRVARDALRGGSCGRVKAA